MRTAGRLVWSGSTTKDDRVIGKTTLGYFPATMDITPTNSVRRQLQLDGDMVPSSVSVVPRRQ